MFVRHVKECAFTPSYTYIQLAIILTGITVYLYPDVIKKYTIGDAYKAYTNPEKLLEELAERAKQNGTNVGIGHLGPAWPNIFPKFVYVASLDSRIFNSIAGYGENSFRSGTYHYDPASHDVFAHVEKMLGHKAIINLHGEKAREKLIQIKKLLVGADVLISLQQEIQGIFPALFTVGRVCSYPEHVTFAILKILAKTVFGIPAPQKCHIKKLMLVNKLIAKPLPSRREIAMANATLHSISAEITQDYSLDVIDPTKLVALEMQLTNEELSTAEKVEKLKNLNVAGSFIAGTNLVDMIMKTLVELSENEPVRSRLAAESAEFKVGDIELLRKKAYLHAVFLEAQRLFSPSVIARTTSKRFLLSVDDIENKKNTFSIPAHSFLFAPIRPRHLDPELWDRPMVFDPQRFVNAPQKERLLITFSDARGCPARLGYTEVMFKTIIDHFVREGYQLSLDKPVEVVGVFAFNTSWIQDYAAEISLLSRPSCTVSM